MTTFMLGLCDSVGMPICNTCYRNKDNHRKGFESPIADIKPAVINEPNSRKIRCRSWVPQPMGASR